MLPMHIDNWMEVIGFFIIALVTNAGGAMLGYRSATRKAQAEVELLRAQATNVVKKSDIDTVREALAELRTENARLAARMEELERDNREQEDTIRELRSKIAGYEIEIARLRAELLSVSRRRRPENAATE